MKRASVYHCCKYVVHDKFPWHGCKNPNNTSCCIYEFIDQCKYAERRYQTKKEKEQE
jgi:hypothetical protein